MLTPYAVSKYKNTLLLSTSDFTLIFLFSVSCQYKAYLTGHGNIKYDCGENVIVLCYFSS